ncbi:hypothetical protein KAW18_09245 [candidate division WOR-3 bacterium]|nr:hypothetical protein [candidate division WOR-3 bacterium]
MDLTKRNNQSLISLYLVVLGMWILFFHEVLKSFAINVMPIAYSGFFILFFALFIELKKGALSFLEGKYRLWIISIWYFSLFALVYGITKSHTLQFLSRDIWPYSYFACLLLAARTNRWSIIDKMIYQQFLIGVGVFIYIGLTLNITFERNIILLNNMSWDASRIYWAWGLLYGWQYMFLRYNKKDPKSRKIATILGIILYAVFGIIMLKRQIIVEFGMISCFKLIYAKKVEKVNIIKVVTAFVAIAVVAFSIVSFYEKREDISYFKRLLSRTTEAGSILKTISQNTRLRETPLNIYNQATTFEILYGQGLGSAVVKDGIINTVVESGFYTVFLKGGIIFLIIWYFGFLSILKDTFWGKRRETLLFGLLSAMFIISSPMGPFFLMYPTGGYQMFWLGRCASRVRGHSFFAANESFANSSKKGRRVLRSLVGQER